ncbi:ankyrin repeat domain-containing protein [Streptomyces collinus]|uniref:ankyrin repeat domain-containing protein n=1 Tax=Streptomyces collinus TaxID=42684 RepID=UPI003683231A
MNLDDLLQRLAEADYGKLLPELCDKRYAAVVYCPDSAAARMVGEASSVYAGLDQLADEIAASYGGDTAEEVLAEFWDEATKENPKLCEIQTVNRRLLALAPLGYTSLLDIVTANHWEDCYLGEAPLIFPGARFVFLASAAPPHHEEAYALLELQPVGEPTPADEALLGAAGAAVAAAALDNGAEADALDDRGTSPLHHAVAHRRADVVASLLAAGPDPSQQADFGNAPQFAALDRTVKAAADCIDDDNHCHIIRMLIEAGAPVNAQDLTGATLLDLAAATRPYPQEVIPFLIGHGARLTRRAGDLTELLEEIPCDSTT